MGRIAFAAWMEENKRNPTICAFCGGPVSDMTLNPDSGVSRYRKHACHICDERTCQKRIGDHYCGRETYDSANDCRSEPVCSRHGGRRFPSIQQHTSVFEGEYISDAKRVVRADFYTWSSAYLNRTLLPPEDAKTVLFIPGRAPSEEINTIRAVFPSVTLTAVDRDPTSIRAALAGGADRVVIGDLDSINSHDCHGGLGLRYTHFDVVNLDLCGTISLKNAETARIVARRASAVFGCFFSYGHDNKTVLDSSVDRLLRIQCIRPLLERWLLVLPKTLVGRLYRLAWPISYCGLYLRRVYLYQGNRMPMLGAVFTHHALDSAHDEGDSLVVVRVRDRDIRPRVLQSYDERGLEYTSRLYATPKNRIAAWVAVRTRQRREGDTQP